jgi:ubiquinone/menaquinone biosynthesis C-methylase UbiE
MTRDANASAPNFDRIAPLYRWMEYATFGRSLERCRNRYLLQLQGCRSALILGDGDGRFLARLLAANPNLRADAVDTSHAMLRLLERRAEGLYSDAGARLRTHPTSALIFSPQRSYDLIVTHFFLDCLTQTELDHLCARIVPHLEPGALWLVSEFRIPAGALHWPSQVLVRLLYLAFRLLTGLRTRELPNHTAALHAADFTRIAQHLSLAGLLTSELWRLREYTPAMLPPQHPQTEPVADPLPDPEPASPSLPGPDPGVYRHEPRTPPPPSDKSPDE